MGVAEVEKAPARFADFAGKKRRFLRALEDGNTVVGAAKIAGRTARTMYLWRENDPYFAERWQEAERVRVESVAQEVKRRAFAGSDNLLMFYAKRLDPAFRDSHKLELEHSGTVQHEHKVVSAAAVLHILQDAEAFDGFEDRPGGALAGTRELLAAHTNGEAGSVPPASTP